jgi:hypothetical protein
VRTRQAPGGADYRPQLRWFALGPLLGAVSGSLVAFVWLMAVAVADGPAPSAMGLLASIGPFAVLAVVLGGPLGAGVGLLAGTPLVFLVGRHLPRPVARRRALVLGAVVPPIAMVALFSLLTGRFALADVDPRRSEEWLGLTWFVAASLLGGPLAARAVSRILPQADAEQG